MSKLTKESYKFKIALLQIVPGRTLEENLSKGIWACKQAKEKGADLAVFPEMWSNGYEGLFKGRLEDNIKNLTQERIKIWQDKAITEDSNFIQSFARLAKEIGIAIAITFLEKTDKQPRNSVIIFNRFGARVIKYSKIQTVDHKMEYFTDQGDGFYVGELDYGRGKVNIGAIICNDRDFPETTRILMLKGAEIVIAPHACYFYNIYFDVFRASAFVNAVIYVAVNYPIEAHAINLGSGNGRSCAISPIYRESPEMELDPMILEMGNHEEIAIAEIDVEGLRKFRNTDCARGNSYRKPKFYGELLNEEVKEPFVRKYARR